MLGVLVTMLLIGALVGFIARVFVPGEDAMSLQQTIIFGIVGSIVGGLLSYLVFGREPGQGPLRTSVILGAVIGAVIALLVYNAVTKKSRAA